MLTLETLTSLIQFALLIFDDIISKNYREQYEHFIWFVLILFSFRLHLCKERPICVIQPLYALFVLRESEPFIFDSFILSSYSLKYAQNGCETMNVIVECVSLCVNLCQSTQESDKRIEIETSVQKPTHIFYERIETNKRALNCTIYIYASTYYSLLS